MLGSQALTPLTALAATTEDADSDAGKVTVGTSFSNAIQRLIAAADGTLTLAAADGTLTLAAAEAKTLLAEVQAAATPADEVLGTISDGKEVTMEHGASPFIQPITENGGATITLK